MSFVESCSRVEEITTQKDESLGFKHYTTRTLDAYLLKIITETKATYIVIRCHCGTGGRLFILKRCTQDMRQCIAGFSRKEIDEIDVLQYWYCYIASLDEIARDWTGLLINCPLHASHLFDDIRTMMLYQHRQTKGLVEMTYSVEWFINQIV